MHTVRASALNNFTDCFRRGCTGLLPTEQQEAWQFDRKHLLPTIAALMGTVLHRALETGEDAITDEFEKHRGLIRYDTKTPDRETAIQQCVRMADMLHRSRPDWREASVMEERLETEIYGVQLTGHPDRIEVQGDKCIIHDLKTSAWSPGFKHSAQLGGYGLLVHRCKGLRPIAGYIHHLPRTPLNRPQAQMITIGLDMTACAVHAKQLLMRIAGTGLSDPDLMPANPASNLCNDEWCPAHGTQYCKITVNAHIPNID